MNTLFKKPSENPEQNKEKESPKGPVNIFSKPIDVRQTEEAKKSRMRIAIIEGLLFSMFLTAITAIYTISGLDVKINPEDSINTPSVFFYLAEFIIFSILACVGNYFLTEKRVNDYNQKVAGLSFDLDAEIGQALLEQEADGITEADAAALNKSDGIDAPDFEITDVSGDESPLNKVIEAKLDDKIVGKVETCKAYLLDSMGVLQTVISVKELKADEEFQKFGVATQIFAKLKEACMADGFSVILLSKGLNDKFELGLQSIEKTAAKLADENGEKIGGEDCFCICELYPGALL